WIHVDPPVTLEQAGDTLVAEIGLRCGGVHFVIERQRPASEARQPVVNELPLGREVCAWYQAGRGDRPRIYHRVRPAVQVPFNALERVERQPGGVNADLLAGFLHAHRLTD